MGLTETQRLAILRNVPFFATLNERNLQEVNRSAYEQEFEKNQTIFRQGDRGDRLYIVASGNVRIHMGNEDGKTVTLRIYGVSQVFGEFAVLDGEPRTAHATAMQATMTLVLNNRDFARLREEFPAISEGVIKVLLERLRVTTTFGQNMAFLGAVGKIATMLSQIATSLGNGANRVEIDIHQGEIARMSGVTREWVSKSYRDIFVPSELIMIRDKPDGITILDLERLREWEQSASTLREPDLEAARQYAEDQLIQLPDQFSYHSLNHTKKDVVPEATRLASLLNCSRREILLLQTAAWYHDIGFRASRVDHETASIKIAQEILPIHGYATSDIKRICAMIGATRVPQQPQNILEQILVDADMVSLGRPDFLQQSMALYEELNAHGAQLSLAKWFERQRVLLEMHQYFTEPAQKSGDPGKQSNLEKVRQLLQAGVTRGVG